MDQIMSQEYYQHLEEIQAVDFLLVELTLYLDTHPTDTNAINEFNEFAQYKQQIQADFEEKYGALQQFGNSFSSQEIWDWAITPWPWQV